MDEHLIKILSKYIILAAINQAAKAQQEKQNKEKKQHSTE